MARIVVAHAAYGCATGCCGHVIEFPDDPALDDELREFCFDHPRTREVGRTFAERLIREYLGEEHVADLDWDHSFIIDD